MDIKKFEVLLLAADLGSLTLAAQEAGYTQSGVSQIIKNLEREFGFPLLHRHRVGVLPTEDAKMLLPALREIVKWGNQLGQIVSSINGVEQGTLRIGSLSSISVHWLPHILREFNASYPNISVKLIEGGDHELISLLEDGRADIALSGNGDTRSFDWLPLKEDPLLAVLPANHPMAGLSEFPIEAFAHMPFIIAPANIHYETHKLFSKHGIPLNIRYTTTDDYTTISFIEQGLGVSVLPGLLMRGYMHCNVKTLELKPRSPRALGIIVPSIQNAPPAVRLFIEHVKRFAREKL